MHSKTIKSGIDIRRANDRFHTRLDWLDSYHSFSFGPHYDPVNAGFGLLVVNNDDVIRPASGFGTHPHQDMEIVTWVLSGRLEHKDSEGHHGIIYPGLVQRMSAGSGIRHSEMNPSPDKEARLVQMWVMPDTRKVKPGYEQTDVNTELESGKLIPVASGRDGRGAVRLHQKNAALWAGQLKPGTFVQLPDAPRVHLFVAAGRVELEGAGPLNEGDAARITAGGGQKLTAPDLSGAEVLVWEMSI